jgi:peptide chain release factor 1
MTPFLRTQLERQTVRLAEIDAALADPQVAADLKRLRELNRDQARTSALVERWQALQQRERDLADAQAMLDDPELAEMAREEITSAEADLTRLDAELQTALLPRDADDDRNAFLEIRAGTGGDESALFAGDLARMYLRFAERQGWKSEVLSANESDLGGYKEVVLRIEGEASTRRSSSSPAATACSACRPPRRRGASTPAPAPWRCCPSPMKRRRCSSTRPSCASTPSAPVAPAASTSTRPTRPCASPTCPPAWWPNARTTAASTATRPRRWRCSQARLRDKERSERQAK